MDLFPLLKRIPWRELALQNLRYLKIWHAKDLTYLFSASVGRRLVNLEELHVSYCWMMEEIVGGESGDTNTVEVNVVFPHLKILSLCDLPALRSLSPDNVIIEFPSIIEAAFVRSQKSILLDLLQKLHHVKELELEGCEIPLVLYDLEGRASTILPRLAKLTLSKMPRLQMIPWKIFPIENLHFLKISQIDGLKFLFPASLDSKGFAQLEEIDIWSCKDIEQVLAQESTDDTSNNTASTTIIFPRINFIKLSYLRSLRSFSSENYKDLEFPSLVEVQIWQCPMMEVFSYGSLNTPRLRKISTNGRDKIEHLDLNAVIKNRIEEDEMSKDAEIKFTEGETSQGMKEKKMPKDAETKFTEGETSQGIEEDEMSKDAETKFTEGETSQGMKEKKMSKDAEIKFTEGETSQGIEEGEMSKDAETKFTEGETSQGTEEEKMLEDAETKFIEGEISQGIEEEEMLKDAEIKFTEGETSQGMKEKKMSKDAATKFTQGETSQGIEEDEMSKDVETKFTEGETSQGMKEKKMSKDAEQNSQKERQVKG
ncbi:hypothetical protein Nepgr_033776 [Nepenthes gracilis]|uniref:Disease resistance protein At4g27190-like leucine-rich repeats domain-containing protein n=1 Tax=Nepenthes gracilis TaxID=150966 RepID=A0AAD3Y6W2_NEPGR|nr:hypothetical protein Nepgr_033776 [Nepenthes gracilis]